MKTLLQLIENGTMKLNDGVHTVNDINIMFINQKPYTEVICKDDNGDILFRTNNIDINKNHYRFIELKKVMDSKNFQNKCLYEYETDVKHVHLMYSVHLEFIPFKYYKINSTNKVKGEEFFSEIDKIVQESVADYNIDNWQDTDDDEF